MSQFTFKNSSKSLAGNTFQEWIEKFNSLFNLFIVAKIVAFVDSDKYKTGTVVNDSAIVAVYASSDQTRLNFHSDLKLWGKFNKPVVGLDKAQIAQLVAGEEVTVSATKFAYSLKMNGSKTAVKIVRAYRVSDSDVAIQHPTGLLVPIPAQQLLEASSQLSDKPAKPAKIDDREIVDLSDFE